MSDRWEKGQEPIELPNPDLNPLQNATLGKNLGRWAQVYFTSPPEKREEAVVELLRELESETEPRPPRLEQRTPAATPVVPLLICGVCQQPNELDQRFCGLCGSPLRSADSAPPLPATPAVARKESPLPPVNAAPARDDGDLEWLREKSLSRLADDADESSGRWKYMLVVLVLVAAAFGVLQWVSNRPANSSQAPAIAAPVATAQPTPPVATAPPPLTTAPATPPAVAPTPAEKTRAASPTITDSGMHRAQVLGSASSRPAAVASTPAATTNLIEGGTQELSLAQGYLEGRHGSRDSAEAAKWLWKAVAKQNTTADVLLADLYVSGDGVPKSCAQARLLLSAAAQKGEPNAAEKLRQVVSSGCR